MKTPIARNTDIGNGAITGATSTPGVELSRIRRALEIIIEEEVTAADVN